VSGPNVGTTGGSAASQIRFGGASTTRGSARVQIQKPDGTVMCETILSHGVEVLGPFRVALMQKPNPRHLADVLVDRLLIGGA